MVTERIRAMLESCEAGRSPFPPTELFNENWLLRLILDWFATSREEPHPLAPLEGASWFSEALLPSAFLPRYRGDRLAESRTHADGLIGHLNVGRRAATDLALRPDARQFVVVEAKIAGRLSPGVKNAPNFDQAARTVACMAEVLRRADCPPTSLDRLGFVVTAPRSRIEEAAFEEEFSAKSIRRKVQHRLEGYAGTLDPWFESWFDPTLKRLDLSLVSWEDLIEDIAMDDMASGQVIDSFYGQCLSFSRKKRGDAPERWTVPAWACPPSRS